MISQDLRGGSNLSDHARSDNPLQPGWRALISLVLARRLAFLGLLFSVELAASTLFLDSAALGRVGLAGLIRSAGPLLLRGIVGYSVIFLTFSHRVAFPSRLVSISHRMAATPISRGLLAAHAAALGLFSFVSLFLYAAEPVHRSDLIAFVWLASGFCAIGFGATAFVRPVFWGQMIRSTGYLSVLALVAAVSAAFGGNAMRLLWPLATRITFLMVDAILRPFGIFTGDPATMSIGSQRFTVEIAPAMLRAGGHPDLFSPSPSCGLFFFGVCGGFRMRRNCSPSATRSFLY